MALFLANYHDYRFAETPKDRPADIDGLILKHDVIVSGVEVKCRNMTVDELKNRFDMKWLITADKLDRGVDVCKRLCVDFRGFLYLVPEKMLFIVPIFSHEKGWLVEPDYEYTTTQATVNGGHVERLNAFVDVSEAKVIASL